MRFFISQKMLNSLRSFPEWHKMDDKLENALHYSQKKFTAFEAAHNKPFTEFARKQPDQEIQEPLFRGNDKMKEVQEQMKACRDVVPKMRSELIALRPLNEDIKNKRKNYQQVKAKAEKADKAASKAEAKLEQLRKTKPSSPEEQKAQTEYDQCVQTKNACDQKLREREELLEKEEKEYKKQLILTIINAMQLYSTARIESCSEIARISSDIKDSGNCVSIYPDHKIEKLKTDIQNLMNEPAD